MVQTKRHGREEGSMEVMGRGTQAYQRPGTRLGIQNNRENRTEDSSGDKKVGEEREEHRGGEPEGPNLPAPRDSAEGEDPEGPEELSQTLMPPRGNLKVAYQNTEEEMRDVGQAVKKKMGHLRKNEARAEEGHQEATSPGPDKGNVSDEEAGRCLDPEGNGVNPGGGNGGGPGPPGREQDKQLITSRGRGNTLMEQQGRLEEESGVTKRTHRAQST
jgi:hypothetical protein